VCSETIGGARHESPNNGNGHGGGHAAGDGAIADRLDDVKARGRLIVGVSDTTPPFTFKRPGEPDHAGYDIDLVRAVASCSVPK
jgi:ABC-type amino acid transport substrate-binding protein